MSAQTRLAEANRVLKRMEEDGPLLSKTGEGSFARAAKFDTQTVRGSPRQAAGVRERSGSQDTRRIVFEISPSPKQRPLSPLTLSSL
jgi:hypothetical protein